MFRLRLLAAVLGFALVAASQSSAAAQSEHLLNSVWTTDDGVNIRSAPNRSSKVVVTLGRGEEVFTREPVQGESVDGNNTWYRTKSGYYISETVTTNKPSNSIYRFDGPRAERWIQVDVSDLIARAMQGNQVVHEAKIVAGRDEMQTPRGTFRIQWRAETRTMDSSTIGIPLDSEDGYRIPNVRYAQYFTDGGDALHGNYWVDPDFFGKEHTSRGCVGMSNEDAKVLWDFASVGTKVVVQD